MAMLGGSGDDAMNSVGQRTGKSVLICNHHCAFAISIAKKHEQAGLARYWRVCFQTRSYSFKSWGLATILAERDTGDEGKSC